MINPQFSSILDEAPTEVARPKPLPVGTYLCVVQGQPTYDKSSKKGTPYVQFSLRPIAYEDDVDLDALDEMGGLDGKTIDATFYLTDTAVFRLDEFHEHCGIDLSDPVSRMSRNDSVINTQVKAVIKHKETGDNQNFFAVLARTLPAE